MKQPLILLSTQTLLPDETSPTRPRSWMMSEHYVRAVLPAGGIPFLVPALEDDQVLRRLYEEADGVLLPGGIDVCPSRYGAETSAECGPLDPARDYLELRLVQWAVEEGKPLLGLCRGLQVMNVALGGTLCQDIASRLPNALRHDRYHGEEATNRALRAHSVRLKPGSRLAQLAGAEEQVVNSLHHQCIDELSPALEAVAWSPDGLIEAVEVRGSTFQLGVQWHPENLMGEDAASTRLLHAFVRAAGCWRRGASRKERLLSTPAQ